MFTITKKKNKNIISVHHNIDIHIVPSEYDVNRYFAFIGSEEHSFYNLCGFIKSDTLTFSQIEAIKTIFDA